MSPATRSRGTGRRPLLARTALSSLLLFSATALAGCDRGRTSPDIESTGGASGSAGAAAAGVAGGLASPTIALPPPPCQLPVTDAPVFGPRAFSNDAPARRELFTWTTAEQAAELRAGSVLLTRTERPGLGRGYAMDLLAALAAPPSPSQEQAETVQLAGLLSGPTFAAARYAWSEPWATRMGWPGETYGDKLVRVVLRPEAWWARYRSGVLDVLDMDNTPIKLADALAYPERLAGIFFVRDSGTGGATCGGTFQGGDDGYREFIIANESMVEEWSLGTETIRARLESDIALVQAFFERVRPCPPTGDAHNWNIEVVCSWTNSPTLSELDAYGAALAIPSPSYHPTAAPLAALIEALQASLLDADPFVVAPTPVP